MGYINPYGLNIKTYDKMQVVQTICSSYLVFPKENWNGTQHSEIPLSISSSRTPVEMHTCQISFTNEFE